MGAKSLSYKVKAKTMNKKNGRLSDRFIAHQQSLFENYTLFIFLDCLRSDAFYHG